MSKQLLTLAETATLLNVTYSRAAALAREHLLPVVRLGRSYRVDPQALQAFIDNGGKPLPGGWRRRSEDDQPGPARPETARV